jgi:ATP-dependent Clp protease adapter protein ClpS
MTKEELLEELWAREINAHLRPDELDGMTRHSSDPDQPFGDTGPAIERILATGASRRDLSLLLRYVAYRAVFGTLYCIEDSGVDKSDLEDLHEYLLSADPSGMEGRPGSADAALANYMAKYRSGLWIPDPPPEASNESSQPVSQPAMSRVLLLNDDFTPMEFVVHVLERIFDKDREIATRIMLDAHQQGRGECGIYPFAVADAKAKQVEALARDHKHPLRCVVEAAQ